MLSHRRTLSWGFVYPKFRMSRETVDWSVDFYSLRDASFSINIKDSSVSLWHLHKGSLFSDTLFRKISGMRQPLLDKTKIWKQIIDKIMSLEIYKIEIIITDCSVHNINNFFVKTLLNYIFFKRSWHH